MKKVLFLCVMMAAMCITAKAQDTLVTTQGKAYLSIVTKIDNGQVHYTRYPKEEGVEETTIDIQSLREIRFYDGRYINFTEPQLVGKEGLEVVIDPVRLKPPSYYLKASAGCQTGAILASVGAGISGFGGFLVASSPNSDPTGQYMLYGLSAVFGVTAIICTISSIANLNKAGRSLERIHIIQNGISLDL